MADAYLQVSCWFDVKTAKNAVAALAIASGCPATPGADVEDDRRHDRSLTISRARQTGPGTLWLRVAEYGDPDQIVPLVVAFVLRCAETFNLTGLWGFCSGQSCSRPCIDAFGGGGACLLDLTARREVARIHSADWLARMTALITEAGAAPTKSMTRQGDES